MLHPISCPCIIATGTEFKSTDCLVLFQAQADIVVFCDSGFFTIFWSGEIKKYSDPGVFVRQVRSCKNVRLARHWTREGNRKNTLCSILLKSFIEGLPHEGEILLIVLISDPVFVKMERPMPIYKIRVWSLIYQHCFFELSLIFELFPACFRLPPCPSKGGAIQRNSPVGDVESFVRTRPVQELFECWSAAPVVLMTPRRPSWREKAVGVKPSVTGKVRCREGSGRGA
jgi:hypothetical protein